MAFLLSSERPAAAPLPENPLSGLLQWAAKARAAHRQRIALRSLLQFDEHRLDDLGISRHDLFDALNRDDGRGNELAARRAGRAKAWLRSS
jgi:uncharacterized protein YjiS (DUF1127 family)